jgi:prevent-host-death family protein
MSVVKSLYDAKTHLSELVDKAAGGEEIVIAKHGVPMARLVPLATAKRKREPGGWEGKVRISKDFDAPLPDNVMKELHAAVEPASRHPHRALVARKR